MSPILPLYPTPTSPCSLTFIRLSSVSMGYAHIYFFSFVSKAQIACSCIILPLDLWFHFLLSFLGLTPFLIPNKQTHYLSRSWVPHPACIYHSLSFQLRLWMKFPPRVTSTVYIPCSKYVILNSPLPSILWEGSPVSSLFLNQWPML